jgi:hypothetical protein
MLVQLINLDKAKERKKKIKPTLPFGLVNGEGGGGGGFAATVVIL